MKRPADLVFEAALRVPGVSVLAGADAAIPGPLPRCSLCPSCRRGLSSTPTGRALFVLDTSYSGREALYALSGQMLRRILESDDSISEFAVLAFDVRAALLTPGFVRNSAEARASVLADVERVRLEGATSFASVVDALKGQPDLLRAETFFLLSDGEITWGADDPGQRIAAKRWVCYAFGTTPHNERLFEELARAGGQIVRVGPGQDLAEAARAHRLPVSHLEWVRSISQDELIVAGSPALLYPGQVLEIALRTSRPTAEVRLLARIDGRDTEVRVPLGRSALTDPLAARAWAETYASDLLDEAADEASERVVFALSRHFGLANEHASFLILETDEEYKQYGVTDRPLDFREIRQTLAGRRAPARERRLVLAGLEVPDEIGGETEQLLRSLASLPLTPVWETAPAPEIASGARVLLQQPRVTRSADTPTAIYEAATALRAGGGEGKPDRPLETAQALRMLSTIAELAPRDDRALRLVGFALLDWGLYDEAERLFARVRARRPFEPQNLLLEALAQAARESSAPPRCATRSCSRGSSPASTPRRRRSRCASTPTCCERRWRRTRPSAARRVAAAPRRFARGRAGAGDAAGGAPRPVLEPRRHRRRPSHQGGPVDRGLVREPGIPLGRPALLGQHRRPRPRALRAPEDEAPRLRGLCRLLRLLVGRGRSAGGHVRRGLYALARRRQHAGFVPRHGACRRRGGAGAHHAPVEAGQVGVVCGPQYLQTADTPSL